MLRSRVQTSMKEQMAFVSYALPAAPAAAKKLISAFVSSRSSANPVRRRRPCARMEASGVEMDVSDGNKPPTETENDSKSPALSFSTLKSATRNRRTFRSRLHTTTAAVEIPVADRATDDAIRVWVVGTRTQAGILLRGRVLAVLRRLCDRCACAFDACADGRFNVLLVEIDERRPERELDETLYDDVQRLNTDHVDLRSHVHDAVLLGIQSRALCNEKCVGVTAAPKNTPDSRVWTQMEWQKRPASSIADNHHVAAKLQEMKNRLNDKL